MIIVTDDADRENEGDLIMATGKVSSAAIGFMIRYTSGVICVSVPGGRLDELQLPLMVDANTESMRTAFTVSVDAAQGVTTGISVADRTRTLRSLADPQTSPADLARLAGCAPAGVLAEIVNDDGTMAHHQKWRRLRAVSWWQRFRLNSGGGACRTAPAQGHHMRVWP